MNQILTRYFIFRKFRYINYFLFIINLSNFVYYISYCFINLSKPITNWHEISNDTLDNKKRIKPLRGGDSISFTKYELIEQLKKYLEEFHGINDSYKQQIVDIFTENIKNSDDNITVEQLEKLKKHFEGEITKIVKLY